MLKDIKKQEVKIMDRIKSTVGFQMNMFKRMPMEQKIEVATKELQKMKSILSKVDYNLHLRKLKATGVEI